MKIRRFFYKVYSFFYSMILNLFFLIFNSSTFFYLFLYQDLWTPLHWASNKGHTEVVHRLLAGGADPKARNRVSNKTFLWRNIHQMYICLSVLGRIYQCPCPVYTCSYLSLSVCPCLCDHLSRNVGNAWCDLNDLL